MVLRICKIQATTRCRVVYQGKPKTPGKPRTPQTVTCPTCKRVIEEKGLTVWKYREMKRIGLNDEEIDKAAKRMAKEFNKRIQIDKITEREKKG